MADSDLQELRDRFADLLDPELDPESYGEDTDRYETVQPSDSAPLVAARLRRVFKADPNLDAIGVKVRDDVLGVATRTIVMGQGIAGGVIGDGDGMTFPLGSSEFRLIEYACTKARCRSRAFASFYDERRVPKCEVHVDRPMRLTER